MGYERWFRGQQDGRNRPFDWLTPARQRGISEKVARALYEQAVSQVQAHRARPDRAQEIYLALLAQEGQDTWRPTPGKVTRTMRIEAGSGGTRGRVARGMRLGRHAAAPGKTTLTSYLAPREREQRSSHAPADDAGAQRAHLDLMADVFRSFGVPAPAALEDPSAWSEITQGDATLPVGTAGRGLDDLPWSDDDRAPEPLPESTRARMERAFGHDFDDVAIHTDSPEATGATRALTRGREIHFRTGVYAPGTAEGDWLIAHELAHVVQQTEGPGQSAGRRALESEADRAASAILAGQRVNVSLGASMASALAFSDSEDHETDALASPSTGVPSGTPAAGTAEAATSTSGPAALAGAGPGAAADTASEAAAAEAMVGEDAALLAEIRTPIPAEPVPGGGGGGGGAAAEEPAAEVPEVSSTPPEQGLGALQGVRPDKLPGALDGVRTAATTEVGCERDELAQEPPEQMSTGEDVAEPVPATDLAAGVTGVAASPGQVGDVAAAGQEQQAALEQVETAADTAAVTQAPPLPVDAVSAPLVENAPPDESRTGTGMSEADVGRMSDSLDALPTTDPYASTEPGPTPELAVSDEAAASTEAKRVALDTTVTGAEDAAAIDVAQRMGEDHIETTLVPETLAADLEAASAAAGSAVAAAGAALGAIQAHALGDADENAGIIAHLEKRAEIDAALAGAQAQVAAEREAHLQRQEEERARVDEEIAALRAQAEADQAQAREDARAQVDQARTDWQAEIDAAAAATRAEAETEIADGMSGIEAEQVRANADAQAHIDQGRADAEAEQLRGEEAAERVKEEKEEESGGFFGWLASQAEAFFEGVKQAISDALEAARQAIQRVIDDAKRLAVEVIEAARQVIVDTIRAVGEALIAIGDRLLAAFPELRERFRDTIQGLVDDAVAAVNAFAEQLKEDVQNALDMLGQALNAALNLLEQGLHAVVDGVSAAVQGAISFAKGVVDMAGVFAVLIKDISADPGGWLGKLGAAAMDGVQNHLWGALTSAVMAWFQDKVLELLGVGGIILQFLMEGGIDLGQIRDMAWEALQSALPAALIAILIEKVVAMIIPAAGAVMAIIEGLQAAWGTVSRIIAAFGAFVSFLQAVKTGTAGPMFANLLALGAVVVIDFVSNWLLRKLASAARRVGAKLRQLAERFRRRRQGRRGGEDRPDRRRADRDGESDQDPEENRQQELRERLERAKQAVKPELERLLARGVSRIRLLAQLAIWRVRYGLTRLSWETHGDRLEFIAQINPQVTLCEGVECDRDELLRIVRSVGQELLNSNPALRERMRLNNQRTAQEGQAGQPVNVNSGAGWLGLAGHFRDTRTQPANAGSRTDYRLGQAGNDPVVASRQLDGELRPQIMASPTATHGRAYAGRPRKGGGFIPGIRQDVEARIKKGEFTGQDLARAVQALVQTGQVPAEMAQHRNLIGELATLWFGEEQARSDANVPISFMQLELAAIDQPPVGQALVDHPASTRDFERSNARIEERLQQAQDQGQEAQFEGLEVRIVDGEIQALQRWFEMRHAAGQLKNVTSDPASIRAYILQEAKRFYGIL